MEEQVKELKQVVSDLTFELMKVESDRDYWKQKYKSVDKDLEQEIIRLKVAYDVLLDRVVELKGQINEM